MDSRDVAPVRRPIWVHGPGGPLAVSHHTAQGIPLDHAVVLCPPLGFEYTHSHRTLRHLADALAAQGIETFRLDYSGSGDSSGEPLDSGRPESWLADIEACMDAASRISGSERVSLIGLRMGASLAALVADRRPVHRLVLWSPVVVGRRYMREWRLVARTASHAPSPDAAAPVLEAGGFPMSPETADFIERMDLGTLRYDVADGLLVVERADVAPQKGFVTSLEERGLTADTISAEGYEEMMAEPQETVVPQEAIQRVVAWTVARSGARGHVVSAQIVDSPPGATDEAGSAVVAGDSGRIRETFVHTDGPAGLMGVLSEPDTEGPGPGTALLLINSGSVHHVGPNRVYVELARAVAAEGYAVLRADLRALGDSVVGRPPDENHPYPRTVQDDVRELLAYLGQRGVERVVLGGICSGAYGAFHAGLEIDDPTLTSLLLINPLTFYWKPGMTLDMPSAERLARDETQYGASIRDPRRWVKMLTGKADTKNIVRFVFSYSASRIAREAVDVLEALRLRAPRPLVRDLRRIAARSRPIDFVFSSTDPGLGLLRAGAGRFVDRLARAGRLSIHVVDGADHTFSRSAWRVALRDVVPSLLSTRSREP